MSRSYKPNILLSTVACLTIFYTVAAATSTQDLFEHTSNNGKSLKSGSVKGGYKNVKLKCGSNSMHIALETDDDFSGVIYTRGSFHDKKAPCFLDPGNKRGQRSFSMKFPLDECQTLQKGNLYSNVLVLQHDKDLILPGDAAFNLECDFRQPREITVAADMHGVSRITLETSEEKEDGRKSHDMHINIVVIKPDAITKKLDM